MQTLAIQACPLLGGFVVGHLEHDGSIDIDCAKRFVRISDAYRYFSAERRLQSARCSQIGVSPYQSAPA